MKLHAYRINGDRYLEPVPADRFDITAGTPVDPLWVRVAEKHE